jgi:phosphoribosylamine--glycine ligase
MDLLEASVDGKLDEVELEWDPRHAMCVVMAAGGYPGAYEKGRKISGLASVADRDDVIVYHAGTALEGGDLVTSGGRVLGVTGLGENLKAARDTAYAAVEKISWPDVQYRKDIGHRAL